MSLPAELFRLVVTDHLARPLRQPLTVEIIDEIVVVRAGSAAEVLEDTACFNALMLETDG